MKYFFSVMKEKLTRKMARCMMGILLSAAMVCSMLPMDGMTVHAGEEKTVRPADILKTEAAAKVEKAGRDTIYVEEEHLASVFEDSGNDGAVITMLADVTRTDGIDININCTLDLNGHIIRITNGDVRTGVNTAMTIQGADGSKIISEQANALLVLGNVTVEGGTFVAMQPNYCGIYASYENAVLTVTGRNVTVQNMGGGYGLGVNAVKSVQLSAGTYAGTSAAIIVSNYSSNGSGVGSLLGHTDEVRYAYYDESGAPIKGKLSEFMLAGTVTVQPCGHDYAYVHTEGTYVHNKSCPACGDTIIGESCTYADGKCACGSTLAVTLPEDLHLIYNGAEQKPAVTVTVDGQTVLKENVDYTLSYADNAAAGTDTAAVIVSGVKFAAEEVKKFSIGKAVLVIKADDQAITYGGSIDAGTANVTVDGLCAGDILSGITLTPSTGNVPGGVIQPSSAEIKNSSNEDVSANYETDYQSGTLIINRAKGEL